MWLTVGEIWHGFGAETKGAIIATSGALVAAVAGFTGIILQMGSQGRQSRAAIAENERRKLKAAVYEEAIAKSVIASDAVTNLSNLALSIEMLVKGALFVNENRPEISSLIPDISKLIEKH